MGLVYNKTPKRGDQMLENIKMEIKPAVLITALNKMPKKERDSSLEDLLAATSPEYLASIKEARADYKAGRVRSHQEVFGR
jgi:hypothetical protein